VSEESRPDEFVALVADALARLGDAAHLQTHHLARHARRARPQEHRWQALQRELVDAVEALGPGQRSMLGQQENLLKLHYLDGLDPAAVQRRLGVGHGEYYRRRERALAAVASLLRERWALPVAAVPLTSFVGREQEVGEVKRLLRGTRVLTLTGPGGVGKTRLAQEAAADLAGSPDYPDGTRLVDLAPLGDGELVPQAVLAALGATETPGRPADAALLEHLRGRGLLLGLDNCEHVLAPCADLVARILGGCRGVRVLATSRASLGVEGERLYPVPPLAAPEASAGPWARASSPTRRCGCSSTAPARSCRPSR
jgi:hypothetical protein